MTAILLAALLSQDDAFAEVSPHHNPPDLSTVSDGDWRKIDRSVDLALAWLATQQNADGSFRTLDSSKPGVTSLAVMAFLSAGHLPGEGPYGDAINRAVDFVLATQMRGGKYDGLFSYLSPDQRGEWRSSPAHVATYNHCICGMMLGEVYGTTDAARAAQIRPAVEAALKVARRWQEQEPSPRYAADRGGIRYIVHHHGVYSDLSVTSWLVMFYRSVHNAGFDVPRAWVDDAVAYTRRCFDKRSGGFMYATDGQNPANRGMTGAGVVTLFLSGRYDDQVERTAGGWMLKQEFTRFNRSRIRQDRYFYGCYYCSQAAYQLGGRYWTETYPPMARTLVANQNSDGSWDRDHHNSDYGRGYSSSMAVLALTPPYQLLPIYQR